MAEEEEKKHGREKKHRRKTQWGGEAPKGDT